MKSIIAAMALVLTGSSVAHSGLVGSDTLYVFCTQPEETKAWGMGIGHVGGVMETLVLMKKIGTEGMEDFCPTPGITNLDNYRAVCKVLGSMDEETRRAMPATLATLKVLYDIHSSCAGA